MIKWALLGWLSSSLTDQLIRLISSRANWQSLHHHHSYKQTSKAQVNQVIFNRSPPPFLKWTSPFKSISHVFVFLHPNWNKRALIELEASRSHNCANIQFAFFSYFGFFVADQCPADLSFQIWRFQRRRMQIIIPNQNGWKISDLPLSSTPLLNPPLPFTSNLC